MRLLTIRAWFLTDSAKVWVNAGIGVCFSSIISSGVPFPVSPLNFHDEQALINFSSYKWIKCNSDSSMILKFLFELLLALHCLSTFYFVWFIGTVCSSTFDMNLCIFADTTKMCHCNKNCSSSNEKKNPLKFFAADRIRAYQISFHFNAINNFFLFAL